MGNPLFPLGTQGLVTSQLGFGCMSLTDGFYGAGASEEEAVAVLRRAYELGVRLFNTSDLYGPYTNEVLVGKALHSYKDSVCIATKWGPMFKDRKLEIDFSPEYARKACQGSLDRLGVESIDLWTLRGPVGPPFNITDTMKAVKELVAEGKVKYVGLSEVSAEDILAAHAVTPITAVEIEWSLFARDVEDDIIPTCQELGIGVMAYSPLGRGLLTGAFDVAQLHDKDFRRFGAPWFAPDNIDKNQALVSAVIELASAKGCTPGQLALAWVLAKGEFVHPIPGTKRIRYLEENVAALDVKLTAEDIQQLQQAVPKDAVAGDRYGNMNITYHASGKPVGNH